MDLIPKDISKEGKALKILWSDGLESLLPFHELRISCLCANCVDEWTRDQIIDPKSVPQDIEPINAEYVGRYALSITWSDGHESGIFSFEYLRELDKKIGTRKG